MFSLQQHMQTHQVLGFKVRASLSKPSLAKSLGVCLQVSAKQQLLLSPSTSYRGYQPLGTNVTRHEEGFTPDLHEALDFFRSAWNTQIHISP